jgi:hypothetical protein
MGGAVSLLPQYAFMVWCTVRGSTGLNNPVVPGKRRKMRRGRLDTHLLRLKLRHVCCNIKWILAYYYN